MDRVARGRRLLRRSRICAVFLAPGTIPGGMLRRSNIFIATAKKNALSSVGAAFSPLLPAGKCIVARAAR
jgi:hypothetical protein